MRKQNWQSLKGHFENFRKVLVIFHKKAFINEKENLILKKGKVNVNLYLLKFICQIP